MSQMTVETESHARSFYIVNRHGLDPNCADYIKKLKEEHAYRGFGKSWHWSKDTRACQDLMQLKGDCLDDQYEDSNVDGLRTKTLLSHWRIQACLHLASTQFWTREERHPQEWLWMQLG